jgi:DNA-binding MarR family transcriptional regulator
MTYLLDSLAEAGLVERRPDPADRRARRIVATARGRSCSTGSVSGCASPRTSC